MAKKKTAKKSNVKKTPVKLPSLTDTVNTEVIIAGAISFPVLLKVCRLCEAKDGPFLNIFDSDKVTAKKIETVMPFGIAENDDLPHKICFRCSAKVEELYEFIQKCVKTQANLHKAIGNKATVTKTKPREQWEEKLNQSNISNDDICDALIKKAMEGIKDFPLNQLPTAQKKAVVIKTTKKIAIKKKEQEKEEEKEKEEENKNNEVLSNKDNETVVSINNETKCDDENELPTKRVTRLSNEKKNEPSESITTKSIEKKEILKRTKKDKPEAKDITEHEVREEDTLKNNQLININTLSLEATRKTEPPKLDPKPFDIMDHVSIIKVNGVGMLFQCKLCNRNFLKKEVVSSHACAKQGVVKVHSPKNVSTPEPLKVPQTVKYITTNINNVVSKSSASCEKHENVENKLVDLSEPINLNNDEVLPVKKATKRKIGPASKVKHTETDIIPVASESLVKSNSNQSLMAVPLANSLPVMPNITATVTSASQVTSVEFPTAPSLNSRYKLMPGPNNTFTLVEDKTDNVTKPVEQAVSKAPSCLFESNNTDIKSQAPVDPPKQVHSLGKRPYPVGLIKSISATGSPTAATNESTVPFPTPAMKKQSYTVVQTGNPSKLLISTKPQLPPPVEEVPKKRQRKSRNVSNEDQPQKQPFSVTLEDTTHPTDPGFFTLINVDPLLQPSYVLPTDNIIQESQISTSTNVLKSTGHKDDKYTCNMCNEKFTREKKLLAHIRSHYNKMDEEDLLRSEKNPKRKSTK